jgi:hypothetical protein
MKPHLTTPMLCKNLELRCNKLPLENILSIKSSKEKTHRADTMGLIHNTTNSN